MQSGAPPRTLARALAETESGATPIFVAKSEPVWPTRLTVTFLKSAAMDVDVCTSFSLVEL